MGVVKDPWVIIDPAFRDPAPRHVAQSVLKMVASDWSEIVPIDVADQRVAALLRRHRIALLVPTEAAPVADRSRFRQELQNAYVTQMRLQATALEVCGALTASGIKHRVLKGLASAFLDYPRPELRQTGDVDLAIHPADLAEAELLLGQFGATRLPGSRVGELAKGSAWRTARGIEIDFHTRLFVRSWGEATVLDEPGEPVPEVGSTALPLELRLVHAAGHVLGTPVGARRMSGTIDVARLLAQDPEPAEVRRLAARFGVEALVGSSIRQVQTMLGGPLWAELDGWPELDWFDRQVLLGDRRHWGFEYLGRMRDVEPARRLAYLPTWVVPRRDSARKAWVDVRRRRTSS